MKKIYSTLTMLAMMVAALSFTACGDDDDEIDNGGGKGKKTLKIDGESFYCGSSSCVEQTKGNGMYINVYAVTNMEFPISGHKLVMHISPSRVSQLTVGEEYDGDMISVRDFVRLTEIHFNSYEWEVISGSFVIKSITDMEMTIQFKEMVVKYKYRDTQHTIEGTAVLNSGVSKDGKLLPFSEAITSLPEWLEDY